jgi:hypothetical protein
VKCQGVILLTLFAKHDVQISLVQFGTECRLCITNRETALLKLHLLGVLDRSGE